MHDIVSLVQYNKDLHDALPAQIQTINKKRIAQGYTPTNAYAITQLHAKIQEIIKSFVKNNFPQMERVDCQIHWIDRAMYHADMTIKFDTSIVRTLGKEFAGVFVPQVVELLKEHNQSLSLKTIEQKGIYINVTLDPSIWINVCEQIRSLGNNFGDLDTYKWQVAIAEYSSPNAAKHLHAGHVRSTVIGYVLSNMYEHAGYSVHRRNHINDRGWFGQLIEGWRRRHALLQEQGFQDNDLNYQIYTIFRQAEVFRADNDINNMRAETSNQDMSHCKEERSEFSKKWEHLKNYFNLESSEAFVIDHRSFEENARQTFLALEAGDPDAFAIWQKIVASSMVEFKQFYEKLTITHNFTIGESFYEKIGRDIINKSTLSAGSWSHQVEKKVSRGSDHSVLDANTDGFAFLETDGERPSEEQKQIITLFTPEIAEKYTHAFDEANPHLEDIVRAQKHKEIQADIWSTVALLDNRERFVVLRSDGGSIYATRDIWCLRLRTQLRKPALIMYEVGQEQADHFEKLFETAEKLGWLDRDDGTKTICKHIAHGFYVDASTKKKLSSRAGASNVHALIDASIDYFRKKYEGNSDFTPGEIEHNARTLGVASIIINDIAKSRMDPVLVDPDLEKTIQWFEQSGGAYLLYTICRAKSLLKKATVQRENALKNAWSRERTQEQIALLQQLSTLPNILDKAVETHEPCVLVQYVYTLTQAFNTLYGATDRMIDDPIALSLTDCYIQVASNVLRICNIEPLERM